MTERNSDIELSRTLRIGGRAAAERAGTALQFTRNT
jgi:hypothetical protein